MYVNWWGYCQQFYLKQSITGALKHTNTVCSDRRLSVLSVRKFQQVNFTFLRNLGNYLWENGGFVLTVSSFLGLLQLWQKRCCFNQATRILAFKKPQNLYIQEPLWCIKKVWIRRGSRKCLQFSATEVFHGFSNKSYS